MTRMTGSNQDEIQNSVEDNNSNEQSEEVLLKS